MQRDQERWDACRPASGLTSRRLNSGGTARSRGPALMRTAIAAFPAKVTEHVPHVPVPACRDHQHRWCGEVGEGAADRDVDEQRPGVTYLSRCEMPRE